VTGADRRVFLVGMMGSGKTTIGRRLARETGWTYLDNDALVRDATGRTGAALLAETDEAELHAAERAAFDVALTTPGAAIIGVAGWLVTVPEVAKRMRATGSVVWLRARPETLLARAGGHHGRRPEAASIAWVERTLGEREAAFAAVADLVVDVDEVRPPEVVRRIRAHMREARATG
jgi:shikimate kinase